MGLNKLRRMRGEKDRPRAAPPLSTDPADLPGQTQLWPDGPELPLFRSAAEPEPPGPSKPPAAPPDLPGQERLF